MTEDATTPMPPPKIDPEMLVIRARPGRAIRFRRGVIIAIAAIGSVSLIAVTNIGSKMLCAEPPQPFRNSG